MPGSFITFTDGIGAAQLDNALTSIASGVASRFSNWTPLTNIVGPSRPRLATGVADVFAFRTDYGASFDLLEVPAANLAIALRLKRWLRGGGSCSVTTNDSATRVYGSCVLWPGSDVSWQMTDRGSRLYSVSLALLNTAGADMLCTY